MDFVEGGKGGYSVGNVFLKKGQIVYVVVGGKGKELNNSPKGAIAKGGYNGGGAALSEGMLYSSFVTIFNCLFTFCPYFNIIFLFFSSL